MFALQLKLSLTAILLAAFQTPQPAAPATIDVLVVDEQDQPVEGAGVFALGEGALRAAVRRPETSDEPADAFDVVVQQGRQSKTDSKGHASFERSEPRMCFAAMLDLRVAYEQLEEPGSSTLKLTLQRDVELEVRVVDASGAPRAEVPVALFQALEERAHFRPRIWSGRTRGENGSVKLRHLQERTKQNGNVALRFEVDLQIPTKISHAVRIDPLAPPATPIVLQLPKTASVQVTMAEASESWVELRALRAGIPDDPRGGPNKFWFIGDCERSKFTKGVARFSYVEIGLELQLRAYWKDAVAPALITFAGPTKEGEELIFAIDAEHGPGGLTVGDEDAVVLEGQKIVRPKELYLTSRSFENDVFELCFVPADGEGDHNRQLELRIGKTRPGSSGWHSLDSESMPLPTAGHFCFGPLDKSQADLVSRRFKVPMALLGGRPYELKTTCSLDKNDYPPRSEVQLRLKVENTGKSDFTAEFGGWQRGANRHARFEFVITKDGATLPDIGRSESWGGFGNSITIKAGEDFEELAELSKWCAFDAPGTYEIEVRYELQIVGTPIPLEGQGCPNAGQSCTDYLRTHAQVVVR